MRTEYNIYCDESCHLENDNQKIMAIGAVWCPYNLKEEIFSRLRELKVKHKLGHDYELKWHKVSKTKIGYYGDIIDYFFDNEEIHYRVIIVPDKTILKHKEYNQTHDDFYYKMYFDLLKVIFDPQCGYNIYIDIKDTKSQNKVEKLKEVLRNNNYDFSQSIILKIQQVRSEEAELIQIADFLTGAISYLHRGLETNKTKLALIDRIKKRSGYSLLNTTLYREDKTNIFIWKPKQTLRGGK